MALRWAASVTTHEAAARTNKGIFSTTRRTAAAGPCRGWIGSFRRTAHAPRTEPPQRPVVQQEEHKRQRHQHRLGRQPQGKRGHHQQVPAPRCRALGVAGVEPKGQHEEQPAQDVLALGHPGDRFDPQGMDREDRRHPGAGPECPGHPPQGQEQEDRRGGVQEHVGQMMAAGLQVIKLAVQHVREPGQRVPVGGVERGDRPGDSLAGQALLDDAGSRRRNHRRRS